MADEPIEYGASLFKVALYGFGGTTDNFIYLNAAINEGHQVRSEITQHPVEFGANVSDHAIVQPRTFILSGFVSAVDTSGESDMLTGSDYRGHAAWDLLRKAIQEKTFITIESNLEIYENFLISELRTDQSWRNSLSLEFEATFQEVILVTTAISANESSLDGPTNEQFSPTTERGILSTQEYTQVA